MTEAVAGPTGVAATSDRAVLHRSERGARLVGALDVALRAMRPPQAAPDFAAEMDAVARARASAPPPPAAAPAEPAAKAAAAPTPSPAPAPAPATPPIPPVVIRAEIPAPASEPAAGPLDIMRWSRGVAPPDEMEQLGASLDAERPRPLAPDVAAIARADGNHMPRDVLEALRERHIGMIGGGDVR